MSTKGRAGVQGQKRGVSEVQYMEHRAPAGLLPDTLHRHSLRLGSYQTDPLSPVPSGDLVRDMGPQMGNTGGKMLKC